MGKNLVEYFVLNYIDFFFLQKYGQNLVSLFGEMQKKKNVLWQWLD